MSWTPQFQNLSSVAIWARALLNKDKDTKAYQDNNQDLLKMQITWAFKEAITKISLKKLKKVIELEMTIWMPTLAAKTGR